MADIGDGPTPETPTPDVFRRLALAQVPRILGLCDRQEGSPTVGCFDRLYWSYQITDFPSVWMQDGCLLLALLYSKEFEGNVFFQRPPVGRWAERALAFWLNSLHSDGSGDEVYPFERSFCATAFSACAASAAYAVLDIKPPPPICRTGSWLSGQPKSDAANQLAAAALALANLAVLCNETKFQKASDDMVLFLLNNQAKEGYFWEYGGYDLGYLSITLSCLAQLHQITAQAAILSAAQRALSFIEARVQADGSYDPTPTSRQTQYLYPFGFAYFGSDVLERIARGAAADRIVTPGWLDDRYTIPLTLDYLKTCLLMAG